VKITHFRQLEVYQIAKKVGLEIFDLSRSFPVEERYGLTAQIRDASRSVCANLAEAWKKRRYRAAFIAKISDSEGECAETQVWLDFALAHGYINQTQFESLDDHCEHVGAMLIKMSDDADKWTQGTK
jgi:four helix bundle protein